MVAVAAVSAVDSSSDMWLDGVPSPICVEQSPQAHGRIGKHGAGHSAGTHTERTEKTAARVAEWATWLASTGLIKRTYLACWYCLAECDTDDTAKSTEHVIPRQWYKEHGYSVDNSPRNMIFACVACNSARRDLPIADFMALRGISERLPMLSAWLQRDTTTLAAMTRLLKAHRSLGGVALRKMALRLVA